ncbi:hypothetical protein M8J76_014528 [Diaphorina citri]|nr:hypothetical protein M8J76_014528 [Diaphorina citri]
MVWVTLHLLVDAEEVVLQVKVDRTAQHYEDESEEAAQEQTIMESSPSASTSGEQSEGFIETPNVADDSLMVSGDMWTVTNVRRLLTLRLERETQFSQPKNRNMLWKQICDILNKENVPATPLQCSQKYRNLCTTYRNNKQKVRSTGEGEIRWPFFEQMDSVLGCKASSIPPEDTHIVFQL